MKFDRWFAEYLDQDPHEVKKLLDDRTATCFLIAWSLFESHCFNGYVKPKMFSKFANEIIQSDKFKIDNLKVTAEYFHNRYQNKIYFKNLMHDMEPEEMENILSKNFIDLSNFELVNMLLIVVYRYRNNIFHGNKGVSSWLNYKEQIFCCIETLQSFISFSTNIKNHI